MAPINDDGDDQKRRKNEILARIRRKIQEKDKKEMEKTKKIKLDELPERYIQVDGKYRCKRCKCVCSSKKAIVRHMKVKHDCGSEWIECGNCGKSFTRHDNFLRHRRQFHRPPSPDAGYHKAFSKPPDDLLNKTLDKNDSKCSSAHHELIDYRNIDHYITHMTSSRPEYIRRWEFDTNNVKAKNSKDIVLKSPIPARHIRYSNFLAPLCRKRKDSKLTDDCTKKARLLPPTPSTSKDSICIKLNTLKETTRKLLEELSCSSSSNDDDNDDDKPEVYDELADESSSDSDDDVQAPKQLSIPASWNIPDHLDLSSEGSDSDLEEQAAALEKLILSDEPTPKLVDYDLSDEGEEADDEAEADDDDDDDDDDLFLICDEA